MILLNDVSYYTLAEVYDYWDMDNYPPNEQRSFNVTSGFLKMFEEYYDEDEAEALPPYFSWDSDAQKYVFDQAVTDLLYHLYSQYYDEFAVFVDEPVLCLYAPYASPSRDSFDEKAQLFARRFLAKIAETYDYYSVILGAYATQKAKLLDSIQSTSAVRTRYNDTPQEGGNYESDPYASSITNVEGTNTDEGMTPMARLAEIERSYRDVIDHWVKEFAPMFILRSNVL